MRLARHLRRAGTRALFVSATGTGKTLVSIRTADELGAHLVLFVVPTLDLAAQTALAWRRDGHGEYVVIVSSLDTSGRDGLVAARVMSTTDPHALGGLTSVVGQDEDQIPALTVICTYDSLDKIEQTQRPGTRCRRSTSRSWTRHTASRDGPTRSGRSSTTPSTSAPTAAST
ncbi:DEAD/DEAH box helicase family protein [Streptomyces massasporeus]|uniref:DEAD/DEAH box helicase family protein n=1 Tax=Streptomyces massasporeus TaxID=67324 RepID=UPI0033B6D902